MLVVILGKSGSGKDSIVNRLGLNKIIPYTTRPMRKNEVMVKIIGLLIN